MIGQRFFVWWLDLARRRAREVVLATSAVALIGLWLVAHVSFDANILRLLPRRSPAVQGFQTFLGTFGSLDHLYVVFQSPDEVADHSDLVDAYVSRLRQAPEIESVDAELFEPGKDWSYLSDRSLLLVGPDAAADVLARFRQPGVDRELQHARDLLSTSSQQVKALVQQDPLGLFAVLRDRMDREKGMIAFDPTANGYISADGHSRLVIVKPAGAPFDGDFCKALFRRLDAVEKAARAEAAQPDRDPVQIEAAGAYRVSLESERLIRRDAIVNSLGSLVVLLLFVLVVFRTPWMMVYGFLPLALGALVALGVVGHLLGALSPSTSGSAGMLFGLGIDGVVLLYLRYLEERATADAPLATTRVAGTAASVALAQLTTAATFLALLFIDFPPLQELGALVGFGILLVCAFTLGLVPALLSRSSSRRARPAMRSDRLGAFVVDRSAPIVWVGMAALVLLGAAALRLRIDTRIEKLQTETPGAELERRVAERFSLPQDVLLVLNEGPELDPLLDTDARLAAALAAKAPGIAASGIGLILPPAREQSAVAAIIRQSGLDEASARTGLAAAAERAGFRPDAFAPFLERVPRLLDPEARITYEGLRQHGLDTFVSRFLVTRGGRYVAVTYLYPRGPFAIDSLERLVKEVDPRLRLTGLPVVNAELARTFLPEFLKAVGIGAVAVTLLIYAVFRTVRYTLLALVPTVAGFLWSGGLLALFGVELDLFSLFAAITFIGISVDYSIYVLHRYAVEGVRDIGDVMARTGPAITIACVTALIGFGTLVGSSYGPLQRFGVVSLVTLTCCLVTSVVLLPALVAQVERWSRPAR